MIELQELQTSLQGNYRGLGHLRALLERAKIEIANNGNVERTLGEKIFGAFCFFDYFFALDCFHSSDPNPEQRDDVDKENLEEAEVWRRKSVVASIDRKLEEMRPLAESATKRENLALDAEARSFSLPPAEATDKLLRYEAHVDKQLYRAMDQLERLQRQRRGENVPPPLNINLGRAK
jgi:hypothetical protein